MEYRYCQSSEVLVLPCTPFNMDNQVRLRELACQDDIRCSTRSAGEEVEDYYSNLVQAAGRSPRYGRGMWPMVAWTR